MRLIHTSDWHLGRTLHGESLLEYQATFLDWLLDQAVTHRADAVVVAGDIYDRAVPPQDAVKLLDRTLAAFAAARIRVVLTSGNHDSPVRLGFGSALTEQAGIHLCTSVADITRPVIVTDADGDTGIYGIPYLLPDAVMDELGARRSHARCSPRPRHASGRTPPPAGWPAPSSSRTRSSPARRYRVRARHQGRRDR